jgi:hypothetical protein
MQLSIDDLIDDLLAFGVGVLLAVLLQLVVDMLNAPLSSEVRASGARLADSVAVKLGGNTAIQLKDTS